MTSHPRYRAPHAYTGTPPRAKTLRRMELQKDEGYPETRKLIKFEDGSYMHPTKGTMER